jgi:hypothetical protein
MCSLPCVGVCGTVQVNPCKYQYQLPASPLLGQAGYLIHDIPAEAASPRHVSNVDGV